MTVFRAKTRSNHNRIEKYMLRTHFTKVWLKTVEATTANNTLIQMVPGSSYIVSENNNISTEK